jgi:hypothetical protein
MRVRRSFRDEFKAKIVETIASGAIYKNSLLEPPNIKYNYIFYTVNLILL